MLEVVHKFKLDVHVLRFTLSINSKEVHLHQFILRKNIADQKVIIKGVTYLLRRLFVSEISKTSMNVVTRPLRVFEEWPALVTMIFLIAMINVRI